MAEPQLKRALRRAELNTVMILTVVEIAIGLSFVLVCAIKGKWGFVVLGFAVPILWVIGAFKIAKPNSLWARQYYGDATLSESEHHFVLTKKKRAPAEI